MSGGGFGEQGSIDRDGVRIVYRDLWPSRASGSQVTAPPVVLVHGMGGAGSTWNRFARDLAGRGRRVIVPSLRGHGGSSRADDYRFASFGADLVAVCDALHLDRIDIVGHSLGSYAASCVAQWQPDRVRRLVAEECPIPLREGDAVGPLTSRLPTPAELWHAVSSAVVHPRALLDFDRSMTAEMLEQFRRPDPQWWKDLSDITARTLILHGGAGGMVDRGRLAEVVARIPDVRVVPFDSGHSIHRDRPRRFGEVAGAFLDATS